MPTKAPFGGAFLEVDSAKAEFSQLSRETKITIWDSGQKVVSPKSGVETGPKS